MKKINGIMYAILSAIGFGVMPIFAKVAYQNGSNTTTVLVCRFLISAIILLGYFLITKKDFRISKKQMIILFLIGAVGYTLTCINLFSSYNYISVGLATTLHFVYPVAVVVISYFVYREKVGFKKCIALGVAMIGVYLLVSGDIGNISYKGAFLAIFSGIVYSGCLVGMNNEEVKKLDNTVSAFYFSLSSGIILLIMGLIRGDLMIKFSGKVIFSMLGISVISTIIAMILLIKAIEIIGASTASILGTFEPIVSMILGIIMFKETLTKMGIIGSILILGSVLIIAKEG
ncbi:DMT family transporter [Hathewaya limosa]|uniref:Drug/metabolite transporter (DMT)-like permease n=1 Tax=Hathewaya limosa TaxID=1536 RepID=A0ABU0JTK1_HATLI|nr:DMT family transporter [Hathewaya limosa]MDQ0480424.1 drug/metabolite transporter (DMT)-like permease [Hathewaya limosa]